LPTKIDSVPDFGQEQKNYLLLDKALLKTQQMADPAELFEAIAHPTRIAIIKILEKEPQVFKINEEDLPKEVLGNLFFHNFRLCLSATS